MLKKTITYKNFDDVEVTKDFYFNLSNGEVIRWEMEENLVGGLRARITNAVDSNDGKKIMGLFNEVIAKAYGERRGDSFVKSEEISLSFLGSPAYDVLFLELMMNPSYAADFIKQLLPSDGELTRQAETIRQSELARQRLQPADHQKKAEKEIPTVIEPPHESEPAPVDYDSLTDEDLDALLASGRVVEIVRGPEIYPNIRFNDGTIFRLTSFHQAQVVMTYFEQHNLPLA